MGFLFQDEITKRLWLLSCMTFCLFLLLVLKETSCHVCTNGETHVEKKTMSPTNSQQGPETTATPVSLEGDPCPAQL